MECKKYSRLGLEKVNRYGSKMKVVEYKDARYIKVYFPDYNYYQTTSWRNFENGYVKSPYCKTVFGVGYIGEGKYNPYDENNKPTLYYSRWKAMLNRCYYDKKICLWQPHPHRRCYKEYSCIRGYAAVF